MLPGAGNAPSTSVLCYLCRRSLTRGDPRTPHDLHRSNSGQPRGQNAHGVLTHVRIDQEPSR
jgi:hypothetical protein